MNHGYIPEASSDVKVTSLVEATLKRNEVLLSEANRNSPPVLKFRKFPNKFRQPGRRHTSQITKQHAGNVSGNEEDAIPYGGGSFGRFIKSFDYYREYVMFGLILILICIKAAYWFFYEKRSESSEL